MWGLLLTVVAVGLVELLSRTIYRAPALTVLLAIVAYVAFRWGRRASLVSAVVVSLYGTYYYAFPGQVLPATVGQITPKGDSTRKAYRVRLNLPEDTPLLIGMTVEANIVLHQTDNAVLVPPAAVRDGRVFVVRRERVEPRRVELGVQGARSVEVLRGLAAGEMVVLDPPAGLAAGQLVRLRS